MPDKVYWHYVKLNQQKSLQADALVDFLANNPWTEVKNHRQIFNQVFDPNLYSASDRTMAWRNEIVEGILKDPSKAPQIAHGTILNKFATYDLSQGTDNFNQRMSVIFPGLELNPKADLKTLQQEAKQVTNAVNNLQYIAYMLTAEENLITINVLRKFSLEELNKLYEESQEVDKILADSISKNRPLTKDESPRVAAILKASGRSELELKDIDVEKNKQMIVEIVQKMIENIPVVQQAHKDNVIEQLSNPEIIAQEFDRVLIEDSKRFFK